MSLHILGEVLVVHSGEAGSLREISFRVEKAIREVPGLKGRYGSLLRIPEREVGVERDLTFPALPPRGGPRNIGNLGAVSGGADDGALDKVL